MRGWSRPRNRWVPSGRGYVLVRKRREALRIWDNESKSSEDKKWG